MSLVNITKRVNLDRFGLSEKQLARLLPDTIDRMLKDAADRTVVYLRRQARVKRIVAFGRYIAGWKTRKAGLRTYYVINDVLYARYAESGRGPGKMPPIGPLREWAALKLGNPNAAYPIAKKIAQRGTLARNRFVSSGPAYDREVRGFIRQAAKRILGAALRQAFR